MGGTASSQAAQEAAEMDSTTGGLHILDMHLSGPVGLVFIVAVVAAVTIGVVCCVRRRRRHGAAAAPLPSHYEMALYRGQPPAYPHGYEYNPDPFAFGPPGRTFHAPPRYQAGRLTELAHEDAPGRFLDGQQPPPPGRLAERPAASRRADEPGVLQRLQALAGANTGPAAAGTDSV